MSYRYDGYTDSFIHIPDEEPIATSITINLDDVEDIVVIKNGVRYKLKEYIRQEISDALKDAYAHGYTDAEADFHKRRTGKWNWVEAEDCVGWNCSECGYNISPRYGRYNYCPNCGAEMKGGDAE